MAVVGLVPARRYAALARRVDDLKEQVRAWKTRADKASERVRQLEAERQQQKHRSDSRAAAERQLETELATMEPRLSGTARDRAMGREHLMTIEVKLDILEGAANVLDARTRTTLHRQPNQTGAAV
jgi:DNA repair exonuclease SbcCD ATPase subunit